MDSDAASFDRSWLWGRTGVSVRRAVTLICAGWLPQGGLFGGSWAAGLEIERGHTQSCFVGCS